MLKVKRSVLHFCQVYITLIFINNEFDPQEK